MKKYIILIFIFFITVNCQPKIENSLLHYDKETIVILDNSKSNLLKNNQKAQLNSNDIIEIENILKASILQYNINEEKKLPKLRDKYPEKKIDKNSVDIKLENYKRQYVPYINNIGQKEVWIYCIKNTRAHSTWKKEILFAVGGGDNYFKVTINLSNKTYQNFSINGPA